MNLLWVGLEDLQGPLLTHIFPWFHDSVMGNTDKAPIMQVYFLWHQTLRFLSRELCTQMLSSIHFCCKLHKTAHTCYTYKNSLIFLKFKPVAIIRSFAETLLCRLNRECYRNRNALLALLWLETLSFGTAVFRINSLSAKCSKLHIRLLCLSPH